MKHNVQTAYIGLQACRTSFAYYSHCPIIVLCVLRSSSRPWQRRQKASRQFDLVQQIIVTFAEMSLEFLVTLAIDVQVGNEFKLLESFKPLGLDGVLVRAFIITMFVTWLRVGS
jgi:hypothetical protein